MSTMHVEGKGVCAPQGFKASGVSAGIKKSGKLDLALIISDTPSRAAGVFTQNRAAAAPVLVSREVAARGTARGVVVNSGCANCCTGDRGLQDARHMAELAAKEVGVSPSEMFVCSTGHIGSYLPMDRVRAGISTAASALSSKDFDAARAIMTTDTKPKAAALTHPAGWSIGAICKGAGMISPNMATMLAFITTDADVPFGSLHPALESAVSSTFNAITIDGDTSTNDTVLLIANGASGQQASADSFREALQSVCLSLAEQIVRDGEGATKFVRVRISGAESTAQARTAARAVAESLLVKTAIYGGDPNWGRVAAAIGKSQVAADTAKWSISMAGHLLVSNGEVAAANSLKQARAALASDREILVECNLVSGDASAEMLTTDLSEEFVRLNAEYES